MEKYTKSKFLMKVTYLKKIDDNLKVVDTKLVTCRGKDFSTSMMADKMKGIERKIQYVNKEPTNFSMDTIYILLDGSKVWSYTEIVEPEDTCVT